MNILNLKDIISIKIKSRHDSYTDQWNRIFMCKILLITSLIIGIDYFNDEITCIIPKNAEIDSEFVRSACWITGFYIYPDLSTRWKHAGYHGIPKDLSLDGLDPNENELCSTISKYGEPDHSCESLRKEFFLQYQWYPFFIATLGLMFYLPYIIFRISNIDLINLRTCLNSEHFDIEHIVKTFFNYASNPKLLMRFRIIMTVIVKLLYITVNILTFHFLNSSLNGRFLKYGMNWMSWIKLNNTLSHDAVARGYSKPGNELLPPMGICEVHESSRDIRNTMLNKHKFICEISQNILYQYCFLLLWFLLVFALIVSIIGLIYEVYAHLATLLWLVWRAKHTMKIYRVISLRECQYLHAIRKKNTLMYGEVLHRLTNERFYKRSVELNEVNMNGRPLNIGKFDV